jgi:uncharacterized protein (TIGR03437 family)
LTKITLAKINTCGRLTFQLFSFLVLTASGAPRLSAAPSIQGVMNAASNIAFNSPVAQGAVFVIKGSGLGPADLSVSTAPFQNTNLDGTSVAVTVGSTTVNALMYYTSDKQVAALLPSNTPTGLASFTVTYNGQTSPPATHGVAASNVGILTLDSSGQGPAIITYPDYGLVSAAKAANCGGPNTACGAANPGDTVTLWGTGLGPVTGDDASGAGLGQSMPNIPLTVWLGGVDAPVSYQGRSGCCVGLDQIVFTVPNNVPTGCAVPLVVQIGTTTNTVSNTAVIPVASGSRDCTPSNAAFRSANIEQAVIAGPVTFGTLELDKGSKDQAKLTFAGIPSYPSGSQPFFDSWIDDQPIGTCLVKVNGQDDYLFNNLVPLDAGSSFTVKGPGGTMTVPATPGQTQATLSSTGSFLVPGIYTISGTGGKDVGPFSATIAIPAQPTLGSPASANNLTVTRSNGMTVTWSGADPNGHVEIELISALDSSFNTAATAFCKAPASAGTFTVPSYVLLALPTGNFTSLALGPGDAQGAASALFTATGLGIGFVQSFVAGTSIGGFALK